MPAVDEHSIAAAAGVGQPAPRPPAPPPQDQVIADWQGDTHAPVVSVLCHAYNHGPFIADALNGMLCQRTCMPFEIIVHDDASGDDTAAVIADYHQRYPDIIRPIYQTENQYSRGIKPGMTTRPLAQGRYIACCEGDDYWIDPRKLQRQAEFLDTHPDHVICGHDAFVFQGDHIVTESKLPPHMRRDASAAQLLRCEPLILTLSIMYRNVEASVPPEAAQVVNGDIFLFSRLAAHGGYKYLDDLQPGGYRRHDGGVWSLVNEERRRAAAATTYFWISRYYQRIGQQDAAACFIRKASLVPVSASEAFGWGDYLRLCGDLGRVLWRHRRARLAVPVKAALRKLGLRPQTR